MKTIRFMLLGLFLVIPMAPCPLLVFETDPEEQKAIACQLEGGIWHEESIGLGEYRTWCEYPPAGAGEAGSEEDGQAVPESDFDPALCDASGYLTWEEEISRKETTAFGTDICDYKITFRNNHDQWTVMIVGYVHDADVWQALDQGEWRIIGTLSPGTTYEWSGYYNYSHDPDAVGPTMTTLEKAALIFKDGECETLVTDEPFLEGLTVELPVSCME